MGVYLSQVANKHGSNPHLCLILAFYHYHINVRVTMTVETMETVALYSRDYQTTFTSKSKIERYILMTVG